MTAHHVHRRAAPYPATCALHEPPQRALALWRAWMQFATGEVDPAHGEAPWIPIGTVGPILVLAHFDGMAPLPPFPSALHQLCLIERARYDILLSCMGRNREAVKSMSERLRRPDAPFSEIQKSIPVIPQPTLAAIFLHRNYVLDEGQRACLENYARIGAVGAAGAPGGLPEAIQSLTRGYPLCDPAALAPSSVNHIPESLKRFGAIPLGELDGTYYCAVPKLPLGDFKTPMENEMEARKLRLELVLASVDGMTEYAHRQSGGAVALGPGKGPMRATSAVQEEDTTYSVDEKLALEYIPQRKGVTPEQIFHYVFAHAINDRATDIDFDQANGHGRIRFKVDGEFRIFLEHDLSVHGDLVRAIKNRAGMGPEPHEPHDGALAIRFIRDGGISDGFNLRFSAIPFRNSPIQTLAIRILHKGSAIAQFDRLGLSKPDYEFFEDLLKEKLGMMLVVGPTGSGKTSTLYAKINALNKPMRKIMTVEDPIEYEVEGITQTRVDTARGVTFPRLLRTILRQTPNVVLIGEMRDKESAAIAVEAALTGHLVLSTLHTNSAAETPTRLIETMDVLPALAASALLNITAQRLIRRVCRHCYKEIAPTRREAAIYEFMGMPVPKTLVTAGGCPECHKVGYKGRMSVMEFLPVRKHPEVAEAIRRGADEGALRSLQKELGYYSMLQSALRKAAEHESTFAEAFANCAMAFERHEIHKAKGFE